MAERLKVKKNTITLRTRIGIAGNGSKTAEPKKNAGFLWLLRDSLWIIRHCIEGLVYDNGYDREVFVLKWKAHMAYVKQELIGWCLNPKCRFILSIVSWFIFVHHVMF